MQRHENCLILTLPDQSRAVMDCRTLALYCLSNPEESSIETILERISRDALVKRSRPNGGIDFNILAAFMEAPSRRFMDCFSRCTAQGRPPRYSFRYKRQNFDIRFLTNLYQFRGADYGGGTFSSSGQHWEFLDGGIISHNGYGWGSHSWTVVEGAEALRVVCLFFGIDQPRRIKGEGQRQPLAALLERMTANDVSDETPIEVFGMSIPSRT
jgi:hypothetical protein